MATTYKGWFAELTAQADTVGSAGDEMVIQTIHFGSATDAGVFVLQDGDGDEFITASTLANQDHTVTFPCGLRIKGTITLSTMTGTAVGPVYIYFR